jgi:signal transduction histidine kinase
MAEARCCDLDAAERAVLGLDHHLAGKRLAEHWSLPHVLQDAMWLHNQPPEALPDVPHKPTLALVTAADAVARRLMLGWSGSCGPVPNLDQLCRQFALRPEAIRAIEPRLHETLAERCADLGLGQPTTAQLVLDSIGTANQRLGRLNQALQERATQARQHARALDLLTRLAASSAPAATLHDTFANLLRPIADLAGQGFFAALFQARPNDPAGWQLFRFARDGQPRASTGPAQLAPPADALGQPMDLAALAPTNAGAVAGLLNWLQPHLSNAPDPRTLRLLALPSGFGPAAIILHDREGLDDALGPKGRAALERLAASAIASCAQHEGARRLSEALAETTRVLNQTQAKLAEAQSMARLGELTAGAAHELNNPLTVISGKSQLLAQRHKQGRDADDAQAIVSAAHRLTDLITRLNLLATPPAPKWSAVGPEQVVRDAVRLAQDSRHAAGPTDSRTTVPVQIRAEPGLPPLRADSALLAHALAELIRNALESPAKSRVEVALARDPAEGGLSLRISDDGPGLSPKALTHAFDPFFSEKPAGRQPGLGLPTARRLVELHGGRLRILNAPDHAGAVAELLLPPTILASAAPAHAKSAA